MLVDGDVDSIGLDAGIEGPAWFVFMPQRWRERGIASQRSPIDAGEVEHGSLDVQPHCAAGLRCGLQPKPGSEESQCPQNEAPGIHLKSPVVGILFTATPGSS